MNIQECPFEFATLHAATHNAWTEDLKAHLTTCQICTDTALADEVMQSLAGLPIPGDLPDPGRIWRTAQRKDRQATIERATLPILLMTRIALFTCAIGMVACVITFWPEIIGQLSSWVNSFRTPHTPQSSQLTFVVMFGGFIAALGAAYGMFEAWAK